MEHRVLEITLQYAKDLKKATLISKMNVYVVVSISGGDKNSDQKATTPPDHDGGANPMWRFNMNFTVDEAALRQNRLMLDFNLKCERPLGDRDVGEVHVPVKDLLDFPVSGGAGAGEKKFVSYQVRKPSGKPKGHLTFSYRFHEKSAGDAAAAPYTGEEGGGVAKINYPVVEHVSPYPAAAMGGYPPAGYAAPPPLFGPPLSPAPYTGEEGGGVANIKYPVVEHVSPYPAAAMGGYPPAGYAAPPPLFGYPPLSPAPPEAAVYGYVHPPPVMQLAPNWWIVDWRYDFRCS